MLNLFVLEDQRIPDVESSPNLAHIGLVLLGTWHVV